MEQKWQEPFEIEGMTPKEVIEKIAATICVLNYQAMKFEHDIAYEEGWQDGHNTGMKEGYRDGHRDGMTEAVTNITE